MATYNNVITNVSGSVGIGTTNVTSRLLVSGSATASTPTMVVREGVASPTGGVGAFDVQNSAGTSILFVTGSGRVGINSTSPSNSLEVVGNARISSTFTHLGGDVSLNQSATGNTYHYTPSFFVKQGGVGGGGANYERLSVTFGSIAVDVAGTGTYPNFQISNGGNVRFNIPSGLTSALGVTGSLEPGTTLTYDIGSTTKYWRDVYARSGSYTGDVTISGNLTVAGTQTIINTQVLEIKDNAVLVNAGPSPASTGGLYVADTTTGVTGSIIWDATTDQWKAGRLGSETTLVSGSGTTNYLAKWSGANAIGTSVVYDDGTNVGIGTNSASTFAASRSLVIGQSAVTEQNALKIYGGNNSDRAPIISLFRAGNSEGIISQIVTNSMLAFGSGGGIASYTDAALTAYSTLFIGSSGNVGIGTSNFGAKLHVSGSSTSSTPTMTVREGVASPTGGVGVLNVQNSAGTTLLFVSGSGRLGIGTTPSATITNAKLEVNGSVVPTTHLGSGNNLGEPTNYWGTLYTNAGYFYNGATNSVAIQGSTFQVYSQTSPAVYSIYADANNRVGIGASTTSASRLIVSGTTTGSDTTLLVKHNVANGSNLPVLDVQNSAGTSLLFVSGSGNVGIGSSSPSQGLDLVGTSTNVFGARIRNTSTGANAYSTLYMGDTNAALLRNSSGNSGYAGTDSLSLFTLGAQNIGVITNNVLRVLFDTSGNVGIGTSTIQTYSGYTVLDIDSTTNGGLLNIKKNGSTVGYLNGVSGITLLASSGNQMQITTAGSSPIYFRTNAIDRALIDASGNLTPATDNAYSLGSTTLRWSNVYAANISGSLTGSNVSAGQVVVAGTGGLLSGSNAFWWSNSNNRVGIGTSTVNDTLEVNGNARFTRPNVPSQYIQYFGDANQNTISSVSSGKTFNLTADSNSTELRLITQAAWSVAFYTNSLERARVDANGNFGVGVTSVSARLHVTGSSTTTATTALVKGGAGSQTGPILDIQDNTGATIMDISGSVIETTVPVRVSNGSATAPSFSFTGGTTTGMYRRTSGQLLSFAVSGNQTFGVDTNGNFGINVTATSAPSAQLHVNGSSTASATTILFRAGNASPTGPVLDVQNSSSTSLLVVSGSGNVGIGVTSPTARLQLQGAANNNTIFAIGSSTTGQSYGITVQAGTNASDRSFGVFDATLTSAYLVARGDGNVGIGTASPGTKLDVLGAARASYGVFSGSLVSFASATGALYTYYTGTTAVISANSDNSGNAADLDFFIGSTRAMRLNTSQNVGIGTVTYTARLFVSGTSTASTPTMIVREGVASPTGGALAFEVENSAGTTILAVSGSGNVGIGTATPYSRLSNTNANFDDGSAGIDPRGISWNINNVTGFAAGIYNSNTTANANGLFVRTGDASSSTTLFHLVSGVGPSSRFFVSADGRVGIGVVGAADKLAVNGSASVTGSLQPGADNTYSLGSSTKRWSNLYATSISGSLTGSNVSAGQVVVAGTGGVLSGSNNFWWDNTNARVGIGTSSLTTALGIYSGADAVETAVLNIAGAGGSVGVGKYIAFMTNSAAIGWVNNASAVAGLWMGASTSAKTLYVGTAGSTSGLVGIGTVSPTSLLTIGSSVSTANNQVTIDAANAYQSQIIFNSAGTAAWSIYRPSGNTQLRFYDHAAGRDAIILDNTTSNIGIGAGFAAGVPSARLHVSGSNTASTATMIVREGVASPTGGVGVLNVQNSAGTSLLFVSGSGNVGVNTTTPGFALEVNGTFAATTKSFVINHPTKPGWKLRYGSLEGPENGVYCRGRSTSTTIDLPDYWTALVDEDSITVQITPVGKWQSLYVESIENNQVKIGMGMSMKLLRIKPKFFYTVTAARKDAPLADVEYSAEG